MRLIDADSLVMEIIENPPVYNASRVVDVIKSQPTVGGWISVEDRLPEDDVTVLVARTYNGKLETGTAWYLMSGSWEDSYGIFDGEEVTHWMPLPKPPEEVTE